MKRFLFLCCVALVIGGCGGGGDGGGDGGGGGAGTTPAPTGNAFVTATGQVIAASGADAAEPIDVATVASAADETSEPVPVSN